MMRKLLTVLQSVCNCISSVVQWRRKQRRKAISKAVHEGDTETVTQIHHDLLSVFFAVMMTVIVPIASYGSLICLSGCVRERVRVVNQPMVPVRMTHEGVEGWWLSDALYEATLLSLERKTND